MFVRKSGMIPGEKTIVTYWLTPAEPARSYFASVISDLAARFEAPVFQPHLTIYVTKPEKKNAGTSLKHALTDCRGAYRLSISGIDHSDEFTKTVFVQFEPDEELTRLSANFRRASGAHREYELNPHLSLIYKTMSHETKKEIARSLTFPFEDVLFYSAKAVISPAKIESRADVEGWRIVAEQRLAG